MRRRDCEVFARAGGDCDDEERHCGVGNIVNCYGNCGTIYQWGDGNCNSAYDCDDLLQDNGDCSDVDLCAEPCEDDGNVCTTTECDPELGCVTVNNTAECDDGNA